MGIHYIIFANSSSFENFCNKKLFKKTLDSFLQRNLTFKQEKEQSFAEDREESYKLRVLYPFCRRAPGMSLWSLV